MHFDWLNRERYPRRKFLKRLTSALISIMAFQFLPAMLSARSSKTPMNMTTDKANTRFTKEDSPSPSYYQLHSSGELKRRGEILWNKMEICDICPRECNKNRLKGQKGDCGATAQLEMSSAHPHFGEEQPLVMDGGSGTVFFTHCSMRCVYCINYEISILGHGKEYSIQDLANMMLRLQEMGCENINVVTPTHYVPHVVLALDKACEQGLSVPLVYNTSGFENIETLQLLDGIVDIYLPDFKYSQSAMAAKYSEGARTYPEKVKAALLEMQRQVGVAHPAKSGKMYRGLMIRHLVLPNKVSGTQAVLEWIASHLPKDTYVNLMSQYMPTYKADKYPQLSRRITQKEYRQAIQYARQAGLSNVKIQG